MSKLIFSFIIIFYSNQISAFSNTNEENTKPIKSIELGGLYGVLLKQYIINLNYCTQFEKREYKFGIYYRELNIDYLVGFNRAEAKATYFGLKFSYINNIKPENKISVTFKEDFTMSLVYTDLLYKNNHYSTAPVLLSVLYFGPNFKINISKKININLSYQLGIGYGLNSSHIYYNTYPVGAFTYIELVPFINLKYFIN